MNILLTGGTSGLGYRTAQVLGKEIKNKIILILILYVCDCTWPHP